MPGLCHQAWQAMRSSSQWACGRGPWGWRPSAPALGGAVEEAFAACGEGSLGRFYLLQPHRHRKLAQGPRGCISVLVPCHSGVANEKGDPGRRTNT